MPSSWTLTHGVIPAKAGTQWRIATPLGSRVRGNDMSVPAGASK